MPSKPAKLKHLNANSALEEKHYTHLEERSFSRLIWSLNIFPAAILRLIPLIDCTPCSMTPCNTVLHSNGSSSQSALRPCTVCIVNKAPGKGQYSSSMSSLLSSSHLFKGNTLQVYRLPPPLFPFTSQKGQ